MAIQAIETRYKGYRFRSRLEARWAVFFDALDIRWVYEHEGFEIKSHHGKTEWYLPDFHLLDIDLYVEIKPEGTPKGIEKTMAATAHGGLSVLFLWGSDFEMYAGHLMLPTDRDGVFKAIQYLQWSTCPVCNAAGLFTMCGDGGDRKDYEPPHRFYCLNRSCVGYKSPLTIKTQVEWITPRIREAIATARAARFEHGETPRVRRGRAR